VRNHKCASGVYRGVEERYRKNVRRGGRRERQKKLRGGTDETKRREGVTFGVYPLRMPTREGGERRVGNSSKGEGK